MGQMQALGGWIVAGLMLAHAAALTLVFLLRATASRHRHGRQQLIESGNACILPVSMIMTVGDPRQIRNAEKLLAQRCFHGEVILIAEAGETADSLIRRYAMVLSRKPVRRRSCDEKMRIYESTGGNYPVRLVSGGADLWEGLNLAICAAEYPWILLAGGRMLPGALNALAEPILTRQEVLLTWNPAVPPCRSGAVLRQLRQSRRTLWVQTFRRRLRPMDTVLCRKELLEEIAASDNGEAGALEEKLSAYMKAHTAACVRVSGILCRTEQAEAGRRCCPLRFCTAILLWAAGQWGGCPKDICYGLIIMDAVFHGVMGLCVWLAVHDFRLTGEKPGHLLRLFLMGALAG